MLSQINQFYLDAEISSGSKEFLRRFLQKRWRHKTQPDVWRGSLVVLTFDPNENVVEVADMFCLADPETVELEDFWAYFGARD